ncbi:hypothetical protein HDV05_007177 [Chytridiales sp. JEL 0842]|nr:hypothetical protein HDV05_007177 [Chytridiales sp. JEL 0842]
MPPVNVHTSSHHDSPFPLPTIEFINKDPAGKNSFIFQLYPDPQSHIQQVSAEILQALYKDPKDLPPVKSLKFILEPLEGVAFTCGSLTHKELHLSVGYLNAQKSSNRAKHEIDGVIVHESVHIYQYDGQHRGSSTAPAGFIEGLADHVRWKKNLAPPHWRQRWEPPADVATASWDQGYEHTAFFFMFVEEDMSEEEAVPDLMLKLNLALRDNPWSDELVEQCTRGRSLQYFWNRYIEYFGGGPKLPPADEEEPGKDDWPVPKLLIIVQDREETGTQWFQQLFSNKQAYHLVKMLIYSVLETLYESPREAPHKVKNLSVIVRKMDGVAYCAGGGKSNCQIHLSSTHLENVGRLDPKLITSSSTNNYNQPLNRPKLRCEIEGVLCHELVHAFQTNANSTCPPSLIEGIADFVRLRQGLAPPHWKAGTSGGRKWDSGYDATAYFLDWIDRVKAPGFVKVLNWVMRDEDGWKWDEGIFEVLTGTRLSELWEEYGKVSSI